MSVCEGMIDRADVPYAFVFVVKLDPMLEDGLGIRWIWGTYNMPCSRGTVLKAPSGPPYQVVSAIAGLDRETKLSDPKFGP